jgi:hypothetical protein
MNRNGCASGQLGNVLVDGHRRRDALVGEVGEDLVELVGGEHALVGQGPRRQRREVDVGLGLGALAQAEGQALERHAGDPGAPAGHEELGEGGHHAAGRGTERGVVDRHLAPPEDREALLVGDLLDAPPGGRHRLGVAGQERGADGVRTCGGQLEAELGGDLAQERVGHLEQDPGAVTGVDLGAGGAAVVEVAQGGERLGHDVVAGLTGQGRHHGDTAGVLLVARVVETLRRREVRRERVRRGHWFSRRRPGRQHTGLAGHGGWAFPLGTTLARAPRNLSPAHAGGPRRVRPWDRPAARCRRPRTRRRARRRARGCGPSPRDPGAGARTTRSTPPRGRTARSRSTR